MTPTFTETIQWYEAKPGTMPEDILKHHKYRLWEQDRESTPYVIVLREHREHLDCAKRILINDTWAWYNGDGMTPITHWAAYTRPTPWDKKAHEEYMKEIKTAIFEAKKK